MNEKYLNIIKDLDIALITNDIYKRVKSGLVYYYYGTEKENYQIIRVMPSYETLNTKKDAKIIEKLKRKMLTRQYRTSFMMLTVTIGTKFKELEPDLDNNVKISISYHNWEAEIQSVLPDLDFEEEFDLMEAMKEQQKNREDPSTINRNSRIAKKFSSFQHKTHWTKLPIFIVLLVLTVILPLVITLTITFFSNSSLVATNYMVMVFGASNHDLLLGANQWWRIFTYPLITTSWLNCLVNAIFLIFAVKYTEVILGWRKSLILLIMYPLLAIVFGMVDYSGILYGPHTIFALCLGAISVAVYKKNDYTALRMRFVIGFSIFLLIIWPLMTFDWVGTIFCVMAVTLGASYGLLINHQYGPGGTLSWTFVVPIMIIALFVVATFTLITLEKLLRINPAYDPNVVATINFYIQNHLLSHKALDNIMNYYK